jgi:predicted Zn-dependent peptidase
MVISLALPAERLNEAASLAAEITFRPVLDPKQFERAREQFARGRELDLLDTTEVGEHVLRHVLFGTHPYAATVGTPKQTRATQRDDMAKVYARTFDPGRLSIVMVGTASVDEAVHALDETFGLEKVPAPGKRDGRSPASPEPGRNLVDIPAPAELSGSSPRIVLVDEPGNSIASITVAQIGPPAGAPDAESLHTAVAVLADASVGRLAKRLRDECGFASQVTPIDLSLRTAGVVGWTARVASEHVAGALKEADGVLRALVSAGPTEEEATASRDHEIFSQAAGFERVSDAAAHYSDWVLVGQSPDMAVTRGQRLAEVSQASVKGAAGRYLDADRMRVVVVGDAAALREPLAALGWGPVEMRGTDGIPVHASAKAGVESLSKRR